MCETLQLHCQDTFLNQDRELLESVRKRSCNALPKLRVHKQKLSGYKRQLRVHCGMCDACHREREEK